MRSQVVGTSLACALGASAFLLPPGVNDHHHKAGPLAISAVNPKTQTLALPCPECAFSSTQEKIEENGSDEDFFWIAGGAKELLVNFTVSDDGKTLELNGGSIYPRPATPDWALTTKVPRVHQVPAGTDAKDIHTGSVKSTSLEVTGSALNVALKPVGEMEDSVMKILYQIREVEGIDMDLAPIQIELLKTGNGELLIMDVRPSPQHSVITELEDLLRPLPHSNGHDADELALDPNRLVHKGNGLVYKGHVHKECGDMLPQSVCKLKHMVEAKLSGLRHGKGKGNCHGSKGGLKWSYVPMADHKDHHGRPHHMRPHGAHHRGHHGRHGRHGRHGHYHHSNFMHSFGRGLVAILIPIMAGVMVGMTVSVFGYMLGTCLHAMYKFLSNAMKTPEGYIRVSAEDLVIMAMKRQEQEEAYKAYMASKQEEAEKESLLAEMEAPPVYEDAPPYKDVPEEK